MDTHRVRRLRWQARAPSPADAFALRSLLRGQSEACQEALARGFDSAAPKHEVWCLPRLELRVEIADARSLHAGELAERVEAAVRAALEQARRVHSGVAAEDVTMTDGPPAVARRSATAPTGSSRRSTLAEDRQALQHYLSTGLLPWTLAGLAPAQAHEVLCEAALQAAESILGGIESVDALTGTGVDARFGALLRWLPLLPAAVRRRWLAATSASPTLAVEVVDAWRSWIDDGADDRIEWQALWLAGPVDVTQLRTRMGRHRPATGVDPPLLRALTEALREGPRAASADPLDAAADSSTSAASVASPIPGPLGANQPASPARRAHATANADRPDESSAAQSLLVPLAGLVLLHPWLPRILAACGVLDESGTQIAPALLPRACALLHAMACGDADAAEHQLPLIKLLLGRPPDEPLDHTLPALAPADYEEITALLAAVRDHWKALSGTGVDGLRLGFLQRRGVLTRGGRAWLLRMQSESFDVLLGVLPWSIAVVRAPWMPEPLMVEWPTP